MPPPDPAIAALAPTGRLRVSINLGNALLARRGDAGGPPTGVSVDLAEAVAASLGLPAPEWQVFDTAAQSVAAVRAGDADLGFFAIDPARGEGVRFSAPYLLIEGAYLVRADSPLHANAEVDRAGTRVVVGRGSAYDLYLSRALAAATIERAASSQAVVDTFVENGAHVAAGVRQQLQADAARVAGLRLLPGRFMVIEQAMGIPAGRGADAHELLRAWVERAKSSGAVAQALLRHGVQGATVAPPG